MWFKGNSVYVKERTLNCSFFLLLSGCDHHSAEYLMSLNTVTRTLVFMVFLLSGALISSCGLGAAENPSLTNNAKKKVKKSAEDVGRVATVNESEQFVLIKVQYSQVASKHPLLYAEGEGRRATLTPTGEKIGSFLAADITKGEVIAGDRVVALTFDDEDKPKPLTPLSSPAPVVDN